MPDHILFFYQLRRERVSRHVRDVLLVGQMVAIGTCSGVYTYFLAHSLPWPYAVVGGLFVFFVSRDRTHFALLAVLAQYLTWTAPG